MQNHLFVSDRLLDQSTGAAAERYDKHRTRLSEYIGAFSPLEGQVGAVFMIDGRIVGLDLFDNAVTYSEMADTLVESYALDTLDTLADNEQPSVSGGLEKFLAEASNAKIETFAAIGEGEDLRLLRRVRNTSDYAGVLDLV